MEQKNKTNGIYNIKYQTIVFAFYKCKHILLLVPFMKNIMLVYTIKPFRGNLHLHLQII